MLSKPLYESIRLRLVDRHKSGTKKKHYSGLYMYNVYAVKCISLVYGFGCLMATFGLMIFLKTVCIKGFTSVPQTMSQNLINTQKLYDPLVELCGSLYNGGVSF